MKNVINQWLYFGFKISRGKLITALTNYYKHINYKHEVADPFELAKNEKNIEIALNKTIRDLNYDSTKYNIEQLDFGDNSQYFAFQIIQSVQSLNSEDHLLVNSEYHYRLSGSAWKDWLENLIKYWFDLNPEEFTIGWHLGQVVYK